MTSTTSARDTTTERRRPWTFRAPSSENVARESGRDQGNANWLRRCNQAELLLGHDLDGNDVDQAGCGYSLDEAYDVFRKGTLASLYVITFKARDRYRVFDKSAFVEVTHITDVDGTSRLSCHGLRRRRHAAVREM